MKTFMLLFTALMFVGCTDTPETTTKTSTDTQETNTTNSSETMTEENTQAAVTELQIEVLAEGTGDAVAKVGDMVAVHYTGTLVDGSKFDSSLDRNEPIEFLLGQGQVIAGWDQGIEGMKVGEKRKLTIPSDLGYGDMGFPPVIPAKATLIFTTELVAIK